MPVCTSTRKTLTNLSAPETAAHHGVEIMLRESGLDLKQADRFYVAGAFGKHVSKRIRHHHPRVYPDMDRDHYPNAGNSSLEGNRSFF